MILDRNQLPWSVHSPDAKAGNAISLDLAPFTNERLMAKRIEAREKDKPPAPECPQCGKPMRQRKSAKGDFWGCSAFPECKGTRPV